MVNHVNLFDPFILYCAIPQLVRGWELESHFKIPIYGWLMKRFGNVPVLAGRTPKDLKKLWRLTQEAINGGTSLIIFPEARRTRDGKLSPFEDGGFRLAMQLGVPIVPVTLDGSIRHLRTGDWILRPTTITVWLHDTIDTSEMSKGDVPALKASETGTGRVARSVAAKQHLSEHSGGKSRRVRVPVHPHAGKNAACSRLLPGIKNSMNHGNGGNHSDHPQYSTHAIEQTADDEQYKPLGPFHESHLA